MSCQWDSKQLVQESWARQLYLDPDLAPPRLLQPTLRIVALSLHKTQPNHNLRPPMGNAFSWVILGTIGVIGSPIRWKIRELQKNLLDVAMVDADA